MKKYILVLAVTLLSNILLFSQNTNISNGYVFDGEPYLVVNPNNHNHIVIAWMSWKYNQKIVIKTKVSFDGGNTWSNENFIPHTQNDYTSADPSLSFDESGNVFLSFIDYSGQEISPVTGGVYVCKSTDGGINWGSATEVINTNAEPGRLPIDRPWINTGKVANSTENNIYITTMNAKGANPDYHPYFIKSSNSGNSFEQWQYLDTNGFLSGNYIPQPMPVHCVSSGGIFYSAYPSYETSQSVYPQFILAKSLDGGVSFEYTPMFNSIHNITDSLAKKGYVITCNPQNDNHLVFVYPASTNNDIDVFFRESFDGGQTWSQEVRVNDDEISNGIMQDLIWADFDESGNLIVSWRDRRNSGNSGYEQASEIWVSYRNADSLNFSGNFCISDELVDYDTILALNGNDFMCTKLVNDTIYSVWGDTRTGKLNIWFAKTTVNGVVLSKKIISQNKLLNIYPNPVKKILSITSCFTIKTIEIYSLSGKKLKEIDNVNKSNVNISLENFPKTEYILKINAGNKIIVKKIIKE